ncbi:MAG: cysteine--tRNA ligase [Promethearchaeota archaeon]
MTPREKRRISAELRIYNSLTRNKEPFVPLESGKVRMYTCGLTVNYLMHVGHARTYLVWDVVERFLEYLGYEVRHVSNITDISVDDNILKRVRASGEAFQQLTTRHTRDYYRDRQLLGIRDPYTYAVATQHIQEMIELVQQLIDRGVAYEAEDGVYFRISAFPQYGRLAGIDPSELKAGAGGRVDKDEYDKQHFGDFVLWKRAKPGEPFWQSPWGSGRPGWHIECSAMSMKYLGETIDISGGGEDNLFPHHENSIAQAEAATGKPYVRYWMHVRHLKLGTEKMSKSTGNLVTVRDVVDQFDAPTLRLFLLSTHYRKPITFATDALQRAQVQVIRIRQLLSRLTAITANSTNVAKNQSKEDTLLKKARFQFEQGLLDDFNTGRLVSHLSQVVNQLQRILEAQEGVDPAQAQTWLKFFNDVGTILFGDLYHTEVLPQVDPVVVSLIELLLSARARLREEKRYEEADKIRRELQQAGFEIADTRTGTSWWIKSLRHEEK